MTREEFMKLRRGDKVHLRMAGQWLPCRVSSQHGPEGYRVVYVSPITFSARYALTEEDLRRLRLPDRPVREEIAETPSLFTSE